MARSTQLIIFTLFLATTLFSCDGNDSSDDSTDAADDTATEDDSADNAADDTTDDDSAASDDTGDDTGDDTADDVVDDSTDDVTDDSADDTTDDTTDDTADDTADDTSDDTADDDTVSLPAACDDPSPGADDCAEKMRKLYCDFGFPIITDDQAYTQAEAVDNCRAAAEPLWIDLAECLNSMAVEIIWMSPTVHLRTFRDAVLCLEQKGWPATRTSVFDVTDWVPVLSSNLVGPTASLNFWTWGYFGYNSFGEISGALYDPALPGLRVSEMMINDHIYQTLFASAIGDDLLWTTSQIDFDLRVEILSYDMYGYSDFYAIDLTQTVLVPAP